MTALIRLFVRVCLFRNGPEDMPYAPPLVGILLFLWLLVQLLSAALQIGLTLGQMLTVQLLSMAVLLAGTAVLLAFKNLGRRWTQTAMALVGVDLLLSVIALPLMLLNLLAGQHLPFIDGLYLMLISWQMAVQSFVFHRALNVSPFLGLGLAFGFLILTFLIIGAWMPDVIRPG